jgi:hypothetical protein
MGLEIPAPPAAAAAAIAAGILLNHRPVVGVGGDRLAQANANQVYRFASFDLKRRNALIINGIDVYETLSFYCK